MCELCWDDVLNEHPLLYRGSMYFECGAGWHDLIYRLSGQIEDVLKDLHASGIPVDEIPQAVQVKEKFGTLRFYMDRAPDEVWQMINEAERRSEMTCDVCGGVGELRGGSWLSTRCDEHV